MLDWLTKPALHRGVWSRRALLRAGAAGLGGLTLARLLAAEAARPKRGRATRCIFLFLNGGPSQLDTFDMKPAAPSGIRGPYRPIATSVPGLSVCERLPRLAPLMHHVAVVRSATHHLGAHNPSAAYALSGHSPRSDAAIAPPAAPPLTAPPPGSAPPPPPPATAPPACGSVVARLSPGGPLPAFVLTPTHLFDMGHPTPSAGGGWLGRSFDPFPVVRNQMM